MDVANNCEMDFEAARKAMVQGQLRPSDVHDPVVIGAMATTAREDYVPESARAQAYMDRSVALKEGRYLNPPLATGLMLTQADLRSTDNVLIVGASSGYMASLIAPLVQSVVALEEDADLLDLCKDRLSDADNVTTILGPLDKGHAADAPYTLILIDGAVEHIPAELARQLAADGRLICGRMDKGVTRLANGQASGTDIVLTDFVDSDIQPLDSFAKPPKYQF